MRHNHQRGFGIIELLVVIAIIGIVASIAIGDNSPVKKRAQITQTLQHLGETTNFARNYSRQTSARTLICAGFPDDQCASDNWSQGWTVFEITGNNPSNPTLEVVRTFDVDAATIEVTSITPANARFLVVNGDGFVETETDIEFNACIDGLNESIQLNIFPSNQEVIRSENRDLCNS